VTYIVFTGTGTAPQDLSNPRGDVAAGNGTRPEAHHEQSLTTPLASPSCRALVITAVSRTRSAFGTRNATPHGAHFGRMVVDRPLAWRSPC
jgi:hypothetical protein